MGTQGWRLPMRLGRVELFGFDIKTAQGTVSKGPREAQHFQALEMEALSETIPSPVQDAT